MSEIEKFQKFLKNKYKFEKIPAVFNILEEMDVKYADFRQSIQQGKKDNIKTALAPLLVDILKYLNYHDIQLADIIKDEYNA